MKPWKEVIDGIRNAVLGKEVREDLAQMGEYVEQFANTAGENIQKAIDATLSVEGKAADAKATGEKFDDITENITDENAVYTGETGYRSFNDNGALTYNADWSSVKAEISDVLQDYGTIINNAAISSYGDSIPSLFFVDSDGKSISDGAIYKSYNDVYFPKEKIPANAKYICLNRSSPGGMALKRNTIKKQIVATEENTEYVCAYSINTQEYTRAAAHFFPLKAKRNDIIRVEIASYVQVPNQYSLCLIDGYATKEKNISQSNRLRGQRIYNMQLLQQSL